MKTRAVMTALVAATLLGGCQAGSGPAALPQRSELFQLSNEAVLAYEAGEDARAEQLYLALSRQTPGDPEIWFRLGNLYARAHRPDAAADAYQRVLSINGAEPRAWYNLGIVRMRQGWAALIQANGYSTTDTVINAESEKMIRHLETMPGLPRPPGSDANRKK